jgi:hypothetical protein
MLKTKESVLYKQLNRTGETVIDAGEEAMKKNQLLCRQDMVQRGQKACSQSGN